MRHARRALMVAVLLLAHEGLAQSGDEGAWDSAMFGGVNRSPNYEKRVASLEKAVTLAPTKEHAADALYYLAKVREEMMDRPGAIAAWQRLCDGYGESPHVPYACFKLGEYYSSTTLLPADAPEEAVKTRMAEFDDRKAVEYFEKAVEAGPPTGQWVLSSKCYLAGLYGDVGREADRQKVLDELVNLDLSGRVVPIYMGPYERRRNSSLTLSERIDMGRAHAAGAKRQGAILLVHHATKWGDPAATITSLEALIAKYPGGEVEKRAREVIEEERARMGASGATAAD